MFFLEEIIKEIIQIDNSALAKIKQIKEKEENIENFISEKLKKEKEKIDSIYLFKKKAVQKKYDEMYEENILVLDKQKEDKINKLKATYSENKNHILENLIKNVLN